MGTDWSPVVFQGPLPSARLCLPRPSRCSLEASLQSTWPRGHSLPHFPWRLVWGDPLQCTEYCGISEHRRLGDSLSSFCPPGQPVGVLDISVTFLFKQATQRQRECLQMGLHLTRACLWWLAGGRRFQPRQPFPELVFCACPCGLLLVYEPWVLPMAFLYPTR